VLRRTQAGGRRSDDRRPELQGDDLRGAPRWPSILLREGDYAMKVSGLDPGLPVEFIEYNDPEVTSSAFEFMLETESPLPEPREV
jgi:hypothetical protein